MAIGVVILLILLKILFCLTAPIRLLKIESFPVGKSSVV